MWTALVIGLVILCTLGTAYYKVQEFRGYRHMARQRKSLDLTNIGPDRPDAPNTED